MNYISSIPKNCTEETVSDYTDNNSGALQKTICMHDGLIVGEKYYNQNGILLIENPFKNGLLNGVVYHWYDSGNLKLSEPYLDGMQHGEAKQWAEDGELIGTYSFFHGTGYDIWRTKLDDLIYTSEIHSFRDGMPHGFEWRLNADQTSISSERHWYEGAMHGIYREWNAKGRIRRGWPKYFIQDNQVTKREYIKNCTYDLTLPKFKEEDNLPIRRFPKEIENIIHIRGGKT